MPLLFLLYLFVENETENKLSWAINFCTGHLEEDVLKEHAPAFLALGEMYDLQELKSLAEEEMLIQLAKENMVQMISLGEIFRADAIFEAALRTTKVNMTWLRSQVGRL